jgi:hypothetical protein
MYKKYFYISKVFNTVETSINHLESLSIMNNVNNSLRSDQKDLIKLLHKLAVKKTVIQNTEKLLFANQLKKEIPRLTSHDLTVLIWSLASLKLHSKHKV